MTRRLLAILVGVYVAVEGLTIAGALRVPVFAQRFITTVCASSNGVAAMWLPLPDPAITDAIISVEAAGGATGISWRADGVSPTAVSGTKVSPPAIITLHDSRNIANFSWIGNGLVCIQYAKP